MVYDVQYNITEFGGDITIHNKTTGITRIIDINKLTKNMSEIDFCDFISDIQTYPAEVLEDMAIELTKITGHSGNEKYLLDNLDGLYHSDDRTPTMFNSLQKETNVHELGHGIDYTYLSGINENMSCSGAFFKTFKAELSEYLRKGNKQYIHEDEKTHDRNSWNYCTKNEREMFAECYALLMLGNCDSKNTILTHFKKTLREAEKLLKEIRKLPDDVRLRK